MKATECSDPRAGVTDPDKIQLPDFVYKDILSVKACAEAAGWRLVTKYEPSGQWGQDIVLNQYPLAATNVDPEHLTVTLGVSTGDPSS
jgi:beta-lactam-binding protein with PASTA domain